MPDLRIQIPEGLFAPAASMPFEGQMPPFELEAGPDTYRFAEALPWHVEVTNTGEALLVAGRVGGTGVTSCARCLEDVAVPVEGDVEGYFLLPDAQAPDDAEGDEFDRLPDDGEIDLEPLLAAALIVALPNLPLCRPDCAGICPDCGINLNEGSCDCAEKRAAAWEQAEAAANPFAALKQISFD